jgi:hypothetical protein
MTVHITAEQEAQARKAFAQRRDHNTYDADIMGPPVSAEVQAEIDARLAMDPAKPTNQGLEELHRQKELSAEFSKEYQWLKPEEYADEEMRKGHLMHSDDFLKHLTEQCGLVCWYSEVWALWGAKAMTLYVLKGSTIEKAGWLQPGWMTEYEIVHFDEHGLPRNSKHRGWRTVLLKLIMADLLTEGQAHAAFGFPDRPCAYRYLAMLAAWRNRPRYETAGMTQAPIERGEDLPPIQEEPEGPVSICPQCLRRYGNHNVDCTQLEHTNA